MKSTEWRPVKGYEGLYEVSSDGDVRSLYKRITRKTYVNNSGYACVRLAKDRRQKSFTVHRLVAEAFIEKPDPSCEVNHKNYDRLDNRVENLEWVTHIKNCEHSNIRRRAALKKRKPLSSTGERNIAITDYGRFRPHITIKGKNIYLGCYKTLEEAVAARDQAEKEQIYEKRINRGY